jgi:formamidopyrimidine-DNA glycosylase
VPELPEVETIRRDLDRELAGRRIDTVVATGRRSLRRYDDLDAFVRELLGQTVEAVGRRGKYLLMQLGTDRRALVVHLGMSGQLLLVPPDHAVVAHTHVVLGFGAGQELRFVDPRTFGEMFVTATGDELAHLGTDALAGIRSPAHLTGLLAGRPTKLKALLMDQRFVAGIGNLYADEILFAARLRYDRPAATLRPREVKRLFDAITTTLEAAVDHRGSSLADEQYRDVFGAIGDFQNRHQAYGREGEPCPRCGRAIVRVKTGGRSTFLCLRCQT